MIKRTAVLFLVIALVFSFGVPVYAQEIDYMQGSIRIIGIKQGEKYAVINGEKKPVSAGEASVQGKGNVVTVPASLAAYMDMEITREGDAVSFAKDEITFTVQKDSNIILSSQGDSVEMQCAAYLDEEEIYLPVRTLAAVAGYSLYIDSDGMIILTDRALTEEEISAQLAVARLYLTGEVYGEVVTVPNKNNPPEPDVGDDTSPTPVTKVKTGVTTAEVNFRESPNGTIIKKLSQGEKLFILDTENGWYKVSTQGWCYGYVSSSYVTSIKNEITDISFGFDYFLIPEKTARQITYQNNAGGVKYKSSNTAVATVDAKGVVTGKSFGLATITATYGGKSANYTIVVCRYDNSSNYVERKISAEGTKFIAVCEGGQSADGRFYKYQDVAGYWTIGYGHLIQPGEVFPDSISAEEAQALLHKDLNEGSYVSGVNKFVKREGLTLTQSQFDALVSFAFNLGSGYFGRGFDMYYLKAAIVSAKTGSYAKASDIYEGFSRYRYAGGKQYVGLYTRRMDEAEIFIKSDYKREGSSKWPVPDNGIKWY